MEKKKEAGREQFLTVFFFLYLLFSIAVIVFKYPLSTMKEIADSWQKDVILEGLHTANFVPFRTIKMYAMYYDWPGLRSFANLFGNVLIFVPMGVLLPIVHKPSKKLFIMLFNALFFIVGIEVFQLFSNFGAFDVDDIILNSLGVLIGRYIYKIL